MLSSGGGPTGLLAWSCWFCSWGGVVVCRLRFYCLALGRWVVCGLLFRDLGCAVCIRHFV